MTALASRTLRVSADLFRLQWWIAAIFWAGLYLLFAGIGVIVASSGGWQSSVWVGACWWSQYLVFAAGILVTTNFLHVYIGHGVTRRAFGLGAVLAGLAGSLLFGALMELGFVIERGIALTQGLAPFSGSAGFTAGPARMLVTAAEFSLLHAAYFFAGWLIAVVFGRFGAVAGTLVIVPAMLPGLLMDVVKLGPQPTAELLSNLGVEVPRSGLVAAVALVVAVMAAAGHRLTRALPVKPL